MYSLFVVNVSVVIFNDKNEILLGLRSPKEDVYPGLWGIPGGKIDSTDKSLEGGLAREVKEEVGIEIGDINLISNNTRSANGKNVLYLIFSTKIISGTPKAKEDTVDVKWFKFGEINPKELTPFTFEVISKAVQKLSRHPLTTTNITF